MLKSLRRYYDAVDAAVGEWVPGMEKQRGMVVPEPSMAPGLAPKQQRRLAGLKKMVRCPDGTPVVVPSKAKSGKGKDDIFTGTVLWMIIIPGREQFYGSK